MDTLARALDLTALRQRLVAENVANIDTPGYHTRDIDFAAELRLATANRDEETPAVRVQTPLNLEQRPDGNNVNIDRESLLMAHNQLQFQSTVAVLRSELNRLQLAISGGSGA
jgi:flagellar basal-body rod protein FlgB